ncbi:MAG: secretin N-terminal domain-containing protein, partial [Casimicrobiaceae bacterium]
MPNRTLLRGAMLYALPLFLAACATVPATDPAATTRTIPHQTTSPLARALADAAARGPEPVAGEKSKIFKGTGVLVKGQQPGGALPPGSPVQPTGGGVVLNFEGADLREVIRNILGDILNENYSIDPAVGGTVTIRTSSGIPRDALASTLETLLRANGATMVKNGNLYQVVPAANAVRGNTVPQLGTSRRALPSGYSVQIVPLRYVGVREMMRLLEPFVKDAQAVRVDELRNLLILAGTERELRNLMDTIDMFDIDWMAGMSVGVFPLQNSDVKTVMQELDKVIGTPQTSPLTGILRIIPIERMNALLVITPQPAYLDEAKKWIERLDKGGDGQGPQFFVYNLQNQRAEKLAPLLQQAFSGRAAAPSAPGPPTLAPGTQQGPIVSPPAFQPQPQPGVPVPPPQAPTPPTSAAERAAAGARAAAGEGLGVGRNLQVVADKDNNASRIVATRAEYLV